QGNDLLTLNLQTALVTGTAGGSKFLFSYSGDVGSDTIETSVTANIAAGSSLGVGVSGGADADFIRQYFSRQVQGSLTQLTLGGLGDDTISHTVTLGSGGGSTGTIASGADGQDGNDTLQGTLLPTSFKSQGLSAVLEGGAGTNSCSKVGPFKTFHCQK